MKLPEFANALRILHSIDYDEVKDFMSPGRWDAFRYDASWSFLSADDATQQKLWAIIEARQPKSDVDAERWQLPDLKAKYPMPTGTEG